MLSMMWAEFVGLFLISGSLFDAVLVTSLRDVPADVALNGTFHGSARGKLQLIPVTDNRPSNTAERHLRYDSRRDGLATSKSRRRRRNNKQSGMSKLYIQFPFVVKHRSFADRPIG